MCHYSANISDFPQVIFISTLRKFYLESQNNVGWKECLEVIWSKILVKAELTLMLDSISQGFVLYSMTLSFLIKLGDIIKVELKQWWLCKGRCKGVGHPLSTSILDHCCSMNLTVEWGSYPIHLLLMVALNVELQWLFRSRNWSLRSLMIHYSLQTRVAF